ncbi:hypothetical protein LJR129_004105 [Acidovorax sp. LjRoot129]|uniref:hypothetical protein n=1 Tax=Acidovorax sp. LjRoot129 TaxID=3342260 RepID=UPI003ECDFD62
MTSIDMKQIGPFTTGTLARQQPSSTGAQWASAGTSEQSYPTNKGAGRQAWMREMERAQASGWFQPFNESLLGHGSASEFTLPRPLAATRTPLAFAQLTQRDTGIGGATESPFAMQQPSIQGDAALATAAESLQPTAESAAAEGADDAALAAAVQEIALGFAVGIQDAVTPELGSGSALMSQGVLGFRAAALQGDASRIADATGPLNRPAVASFVPIFPQAASLSVALSSLTPQNTTSLNATAPSQHTDGVDGALHSSSLPRALLSGQTATRLHSAWTAEGLNLWLGMDGSAQQVRAQAAMIVSTLQQTLKGHGQRLNRVVCNGSVVFDASASSGVTLRDFSAELERHASSSPSIEPRSFLSQKEIS